MFEKEAEEWVKENMDCCKTDNSVNQSIPYFSEEERCCAKSAFKDGAEFGYNKCREEMQKNGLALQSDMDKTIEQNVALKKELEKTKWHKVREQVPTEEKNYLVKLTDGTVDVMTIALDGNLEPYLLTSNFDFYKDVEKWCEIPEE